MPPHSFQFVGRAEFFYNFAPLSFLDEEKSQEKKLVPETQA